MKGYVVITETKVFELKTLDLITWEENDKVCYGIDLGNECIQKVERQVFEYLKILDCDNFSKAIRYIMKKGKIKDYAIVSYDKDNLCFWNGNLELSRTKLELEDKNELDKAILVFERRNNVKLGIDNNHYYIEDNALNRLNFYELKYKLEEVFDKLAED